mmetsp:Transcript_29189/g.52870  ORF Transcript_29189/g.52870 Transcript_29189/m.52870 type:complete len:200 (+) Transcript_29189:156-755(+)
MRQTPKLNRILHQNHRILRHQDRICHRLQKLRIHNLLIRRTKRYNIVLGFRRYSHSLRMTQGAKCIGTYYPRRGLALVGNTSAKSSLVPRVESTSFDILLGSPATIVGHVHEGTMPGATAKTFQSYRTRSTKYVQMSCLTAHPSYILIHAKACKCRVYRLTNFAHHGTQVNIGRCQLSPPNGSTQDTKIRWIVVSLSIA